MTVVVLMSLLAFLVFALLTRLTFQQQLVSAETGAQQAERLADYGVERIVAEMRNDLAARADSLLEFEDGSRLYRSTNPDSDPNVPRRLLSEEWQLSPLAWQSGAVGTAVGVSTLLASEIPTDQPSRDGRSVSSQIWNEPALLPQGALLEGGNSPRWVYLDRRGQTPVALAGAGQQNSVVSGGVLSDDFVVGRFAYQVYDVSGLLDANVAGYGNGVQDQEISRKGSLLWADLAALPGGSRDLPDWRLPLDWAQAHESFEVPFGRRNGWLEAPINVDVDSNRFFSRGDLLDFQKRFPNYLNQESLRFFSCFSRDLNAPSWGPTWNAQERGGNGRFAYRDQADDPTSANRFTPGVRVTQSFERRLSPFPEADEIPVVAEVGEPLMNRRFPLSALALFEAGDEEAIRRHFGLIRESDEEFAWRYGELNGDFEIKTLAEVAQEGREPNFFEVLKAGILSGSLNKTNGVGNANTAPLFDNQSVDSQPARQILTIGACLIDQYDLDSDPTTLAPVASDAFGAEAGTPIAGVENVPYLDVMGQIHVTRRDLAGYPEWPQIGAYYQLQLWNPHLNASDAEPGEFRVISEGESYASIRWWPNGRPGGPSFEEDGSPFFASAATSFMQFQTPLPNTGTGRSFCEQPVQLMADMLSSHSPYSVLGGQFAGIFLGNAVTGSNAINRRRYQRYGVAQGHIKFFRPVSIKLQKRIAGRWMTYQTIPNIEQHHGNIPWPAVEDENVYQGVPQLRISYARPDPRSIRFGLGSAGSGTSAKAVERTIWPQNNELLSWRSKWTPGPLFTGNAGAFGSLGLQPQGALSYQGYDGVSRPSDSFGNNYNENSPHALGAARPIVLNRPFRNVGEMGYAFRDDPWRTLDFASRESADAGLLDLFSVTDTDIRAGVVNLNQAPVEVLQALISGSLQNQADSTLLSDASAQALSQALFDRLRVRPITSVGELPDVLSEIGSGLGVQAYEVETLARSLADVHSDRVLNLMVDVIAQSGRLLPSANSLADFRVNGQRRLWVHLAIDRLTGQVIERHTEAVY